MSMREKIAKSIYERRNGHGAKPWAHQPQAHRDPYLSDADADLDALMEPTEPMVFVGLDAMSRDDLEPTEDEFLAGFTAAIRAAKEGK